MDRGRAAERDQRSVGELFAALDRVYARRPGHVFLHHLGDAQHQSSPSSPSVPRVGVVHRTAGARGVESHRAAGEVLDIDPA
jgi:hypothetical protein